MAEPFGENITEGNNHIRVPRGSYTEYLNSGHQTMIDNLNSLRDNVLVIGSDLSIVIQTGVSQTGLNRSYSITIDRETNPLFLTSFVSNLQGFKFQSGDKGRPGSMTVGGVNYQPGRFDVYLTKNFYEENHAMYDSFCEFFNSLCQSQYVNITKGYSHSGKYVQSESHFGNMLSISTPIHTIILKSGNSTIARYCNVKFYSPVIQSGNFIKNESIILQFNFDFSYISLGDTNDKF